MRAEIGREQRDPIWAKNSEEFVAQVMREDLFRKGTASELYCGTSRCGFVLGGVPKPTTPEPPHMTAIKLSKRLHEHFQAVRVFESPTKEGAFDIQVIATRQGYSLRGKQVGR